MAGIGTKRLAEEWASLKTEKERAECYKRVAKYIRTAQIQLPRSTLWNMTLQDEALADFKKYHEKICRRTAL